MSPWSEFPVFPLLLLLSAFKDLILQNNFKLFGILNAWNVFLLETLEFTLKLELCMQKLKTIPTYMNVENVSLAAKMWKTCDNIRTRMNKAIARYKNVIFLPLSFSCATSNWIIQMNGRGKTMHIHLIIRNWAFFRRSGQMVKLKKLESVPDNVNWGTE